MAAEIVDACAKKNVQCTVFDGVVPNPTVSCIDAGVRNRTLTLTFKKLK